MALLKSKTVQAWTLPVEKGLSIGDEELLEAVHGVGLLEEFFRWSFVDPDSSDGGSRD